MIYQDLVVVLICMAGTAHGWGPKGHEIATSVACKLLSSNTGADLWTRKLLNSDNLCVGMNAQNSFADDIGKSDGTWLYHFVNTPFRGCSPYVFERDCGNSSLPSADRKCLVTGIARYISDLVRTDVPPPTQKVALKMLIHLMADLHQPMHISFQEDVGGNIIHLSSPDLSLHEVWDWKLIEDVDATSFITGYVNQVSLKRYAGFDVNDNEDVVRWLSEIVSEVSTTYTCPIAYKNELGSWIESGNSLSGAYLWDRRGAAMTLLELAGSRMAVLFKKISAVWSKREMKAAPEPLLPPAAPIFECTNPFSCLTMDDIEFVPEEVVLRFTDPIKKAKAKKNIPDEMFGGVNLSRLVLLKRPDSKQFFVTNRGVAVDDINGFHAITITFPRNRRGNTSVVLLFDVQVFGGAAPPAHDMVRSVVYKLHGEKRAKPGVLGKSVTSIDTIDGAFSGVLKAAAMQTVDDAHSARTVSPSGVRFRLENGGYVIVPESLSKITTKYDLIKKFAADEFGAHLTEKDLVEKYGLSMIERKCGSLVRMYTPNMSFFTTEGSIRKSNAKPNKPLRGLVYEVVGINDAVRTVIVDTELIETTMTNDIQKAMIHCAKNNGKDSDLYHLVLRPTIYLEMQELYQRVIDMKENRPIAQGLIQRFFYYAHPLVPGASVVEWTLY